ncbi:MAG: HNH endonuclease [Chloroflexi bacterium]|nr:HNH endonuclease [Chloroflexota bacterium]
MPHEFSAYPENWTRLAWFVKRRDGMRCVECGATDEVLHAHHIIPLSRGGTNHPNNLQTLCENCHAEKHPHMLAEREQHAPRPASITYTAPTVSTFKFPLTIQQIIVLEILALGVLAIYTTILIVILTLIHQ